MSPRSAGANLSCRFTRPSCKCSRAGKIYHILMAFRSEFVVSGPLFCRCSPKALIEEAKRVGINRFWRGQESTSAAETIDGSE